MCFKSIKKLKLNSKKFFAIICAFLFIAEFSLGGIPALAATTPTVSYSVVGEPAVGNTITINLNVSNASNLYGGSWDFIYDTSMLEISKEGIAPGSFLGNDVQKKVSFSEGQAYIWMTNTGTKTGFSGNGTIATIKAKVLKEGKVSIKTTNTDASFSANKSNSLVKLADNNGWKVAYTGVDSEIITTSKPTIKNLDAQIVSENIPTSMETGKSYPISIQVKNTGNETWTAAKNHRLGVLTSNNKFNIANRHYLDNSISIAPGEVATFSFSLTAPEIGNYTLEFQMVKDGVSWFGNKVSKSITVRNPSIINSYEENNSLITYTGTWNNSTGTSYSGGNSKYSTTANSSFNFSFKGTGFRWYALSNNSRGIADIYIDGIKMDTVDTFSSTTVNNKILYQNNNLSNSEHSVKIVVTGKKNSSSTSTIVQIDKLDILNGSLIAPTPANSFEETNPLIKYTGTWNDSASASYSDGNSKYSATTNSSFNFRFKGTGFRWFGLANNSRGIADIYIDGIKVSSVDTFSNTPVNDKMFFETSNLTNTEHLAQVVVTGKKNTSATNCIVQVDKLDILNGILVSGSTVSSYEESNPLINYAGTWSDSASASYSGGNSKYSTTANSSFNFSFKGTGFRWYALSNNSRGIADIYIDGIKVDTIDTFSSTAINNKMLYQNDNLSNSEHSVKIVVTGRKNPSSTNTIVQIDKINILNGSLVIPTPMNSFEETNPLIKYTGTWNNSASTSYSDGNSKYSATTNSSFNFRFKGTGFRWFGLANNTRGIADIYIDGIKVSSVDTFSDVPVNNKIFFQTNNLSNTDHLVQVVVTGKKNTSATNCIIQIDKVAILNGNLL